MTSKDIIIEKITQFVKQHHANDFSGHDFEHVKRVVELAKKIAQTEPMADHFVVELAALLHDVDDYKLGNINTHNASMFMESLNIDHTIIQKVLDVIDNIGFSKSGYSPNLSNIETKIVYDADKLDGIGAIGIARAFAYGGNKNRTLFNSQQLPRQFELNSYKNNSLYGGDHSVNHFFDKLLHIAPLMQTKIGKELAQCRQTIMINFLDNFFKEQDLENWQELLNSTINNQDKKHAT